MNVALTIGTLSLLTAGFVSYAQSQPKPDPYHHRALQNSSIDDWHSPEASQNAFYRGFYKGRSLDLYNRDFELAGPAFSDARSSEALLLAQSSSDLPDMGTGNDSTEPAATPRYTQAQINEMMNNPLGELWLLVLQNDTTSYDGDALEFLGEDSKIFNTTTLQPVMPFQLTEDVKWIFRPVIPIYNWDAPSVSHGTPSQFPGGDLPFSVDFKRKSGMGDIVLWNAFATNQMARPPNIFGFGVTMMLDTATDDVFGTGKWSAGPMGLAVHIGPPGGWIYGAIVQHWWDYAGDDDRDDVSLSNIQYIAFYRLSAKTNIGFGGPNITVNWEADSGNQWTVPIGLAINTTVKIGPLPVKVGIEAYKYVEQPDRFGAEWGVRLFATPVVPSPGMSKVPFFGSN